MLTKQLPSYVLDTSAPFTVFKNSQSLFIACFCKTQQGANVEEMGVLLSWQELEVC